MAEASSRDLHPTTGARFVFERVGDERYRVEVHLPDAARAGGEIELGQAEVRLDDPPTPADAAWIEDEVVKLARVLRRAPRARLSRWRAAPS